MCLLYLAGQGTWCSGVEDARAPRCCCLFLCRHENSRVRACSKSNKHGHVITFLASALLHSITYACRAVVPWMVLLLVVI
jgi:hypothetical protein